MLTHLHKDLQRLLLLQTTAKTFYAFSHLSKHTSKVCLEARYQQISRKRLLIVKMGDCDTWAFSYLPNGKKEGIQYAYYEETHTLLFKRHWKHGKYHGWYELWWDDGTLALREFWVEGRMINKQMVSLWSEGR